MVMGLRRLWRNEGGASAVEFAIVGSVFIVLCLAILQLGWALQIRNQISQVADAAVRSIVIDPDASDSALEAQVYSALAEYDAGRLHVEAGEATVDTIAFRTLNIKYDMELDIPFFPTNLVTLNVSRRTRVP